MGSTQLQSLNDAIIGIKIDCLPSCWSDHSRARKQQLPILSSVPISRGLNVRVLAIHLEQIVAAIETYVRLSVSSFVANFFKSNATRDSAAKRILQVRFEM